MRARIEDVARQAGVSTKTVSRVLNHEPNVREQTRERVLEVVRKLDYRPNPSARSLAANRSFLIALLYDNPSPNYVMEIQGGVLEACDAHQFSMMVRPLDSQAPDFVATVQSLIGQQRPDGLILTPPITDHPELLAHLDQLDLPYATVSSRIQGSIGVTMDETRAAAEITSHLVRLGHRRIAHVIGHPAHGGSELRLAGYRKAMAEAGIDVRSEWVVPGAFSFASGVAAARQLMALDSPPTAIFAANDDMAAGVIWATADAGWRVPQDLSVAGFDDTPISRQVWPAVSTVRQPSRDMGRIAALQLLRRIRHGEPGELVQVPYTLQLRDSTASCKRDA
ncbi:LacI family DNA-binding transcriptional regulator [Oleiagrimonas sp. C23AA]|uniref:LacI family DNA-binding transcriptional regulator n=1 Tax=Oleiagrimonas sp. C23AA TaxID=2719047 RepID=UPI00141DBEC5|nr:LacI family DNA-binding transcriptional regulator [Oleiagrimonas sp. C23AA]NII11646.1 LacI family transcriptional regulator [Oleiagrimonas sp. C23AA]